LGGDVILPSQPPAVLYRLGKKKMDHFKGGWGAGSPRRYSSENCVDAKYLLGHAKQTHFGRVNKCRFYVWIYEKGRLGARAVVGWEQRRGFFRLDFD